eukprot:6196451-Pleurochrysis_carterae.AAC.1
MFIGDVINVQTMYGGHKIPVRGYDAVSDTFDAATVQARRARAGATPRRSLRHRLKKKTLNFQLE